MNYEDYSKEDLIGLVRTLNSELDTAQREIDDLEYEGCRNVDELMHLGDRVMKLENQVIGIRPETVLDEMKWEILMDLKELHIEKLEDIRDVYINHNNIYSIINKATDDAFAKEWINMVSQNFLPIDEKTK